MANQEQSNEPDESLSGSAVDAGAPSNRATRQNPLVSTASGMGPAWDFATAGAELAGIVIVLTLLGYWVDTKFGTLPWFTAGLGVFGVFGGLMRTVRQAMRIMDKANHSAEADRPSE